MAKHLWLPWSIFSFQNSWEIPPWWLTGIGQHVKINPLHGRLLAHSAQEAGCSCESASPWQHSSEMNGDERVSLSSRNHSLAARAMGPTFNFKPWRSRSSHGPCTQRVLCRCRGEEWWVFTWLLLLTFSSWQAHHRACNLLLQPETYGQRSGGMFRLFTGMLIYIRWCMQDPSLACYIIASTPFSIIVLSFQLCVRAVVHKGLYPWKWLHSRHILFSDPQESEGWWR